MRGALQFVALQFVALVQRDTCGPELDSYVTTGTRHVPAR